MSQEREPEEVEQQPAEMASAPTEVEMEAGGLRVRVSAPSVALSVAADTAWELWQKGNASTPRRQVGFEAQNTPSIERRAVTDQGWSPDGSSWDSGRD